VDKRAVSSVIDSYRESTKDLSEVPKHADELLVYDNTAHRRGFRVVARFIGGKLSKTTPRRYRTGLLECSARDYTPQSNTRKPGVNANSFLPLIHCVLWVQLAPSIASGPVARSCKIRTVESDLSNMQNHGIELKMQSLS